jgi:hypothetical protein
MDPGGAGGEPPEGGAPGTSGAGQGGEGGDMTPPECTQPSDCDDARGPSPCGSWACNANGECEASATGCTDVDRDGYGAGTQCQCAALDCDDDDASVHSDASESCYTGPSGTRGIGTCQAGARVCVAGVWGPCTGEIIPSGEACNGEDDDCDQTPDDGLGQLSCGMGKCRVTVAACVSGVTGTCRPDTSQATADNCSGMPGVDDDCDGGIDEDCTTGTTSATCFRVIPGNNTNDTAAAADPTGLTPFGTVQAAIDFADANRNISTRVCIAPGAACGTNAQFPSVPNQPIVMKDGISVYGNYQSTSWARCANSRTRLRPESALGVSFAFTAAANSTTVLDGVEIDRDDTPTTSGVTVDGARGVILANIVIDSAPVVMNSYGVNVVNGGQATIFKSRIVGGAGTAETIGVRSVASQVFVEDNCLSPDTTTGRCDDYCSTTNPGIRSRNSNTGGTGVAYSVFLSSSPSSRIERSTLCWNDGDTGAQVRVTGNANGLLIRGNLVSARGGAQDSHGIWLEDCGGAEPWIVDNQRIEVAGDTLMTRADAIRAVGDCHPVVDSNVLITGAGEGQGSEPTGVRCSASAGVSSRCIVVDNLDIRGSEEGFPNIAAGVRCESGSCVRVAGNVITGRGGGQAYGVILQTTGAFVDRNVIRGGCSANAVGVHAEDSWARIQNNRVFGYYQSDCLGTIPTPSQSTGLRVLTSAGLRELDVHSNYFDGSGPPNAGTACTSRAVSLGIHGTPPTAANGIFRNDILRAGTCATRYGFEELAAAADPSVLENLDFDPTGTPTALFFDEATTALTTPAAIDLLTDTTVKRTLSVDPLFVAYPTDLHLQGTSMCIDAGSATGAPTWDMDATPRSGTPDIGPDEH